MGGFFEEKIDVKAEKSLVITTILEILQTDEPARFNVKVKPSLDNESQSFIYICCDECHFRINVDYNSVFNCNTCKETRMAKPRFRFRLSVYDETGSLEVTIFGKDGDLIMGMSAQEFYDATLKEEAPPITLVNHGLKDLEVHMKIRSSIFQSLNGKATMVYNLLAMECVDGFAGFPLPPAPSPNRFSSTTAVYNTALEVNEKTAKRKLDFASSLSKPDVELSGLGLGKLEDIRGRVDASVRRRLIKRGKAKIGEGDVPYVPGSVISFEDLTMPSVGLHENASSDDEKTLSDMIHASKARGLSRISPPNKEHTIHYDHATFQTDRLTKVGNARKKQPGKRSLHPVLIDDSSSEEELNVDATKQATEIKTSARGRIIKPKIRLDLCCQLLQCDAKQDIRCNHQLSKTI